MDASGYLAAWSQGANAPEAWLYGRLVAVLVAAMVLRVVSVWLIPPKGGV